MTFQSSKENSQTINSRIKEIKISYFGDKRGSHKQFCDTVGVKSNTASNWMKDGYPVGMDVISQILKAFPDIRSNWLITGEGDIYSKESSISKTEEATPLAADHVIYVPLVNQYAHAGYLCGYADAEYIETLPTIPFLVDKEAHGNYVAFEVRGDSMDDGTDEAYKEGDRLLCKEIPLQYWAQSKLHIRKWDFVIVHEEGILIKRIIDHDVPNHTLTIHSLNSFYPDRDIDLIEVKQIFKVVESQRTRRR